MGRPLAEWEERRWRLHDLRHAFAFEALLAGARHDLLALRDHLGHASVKTTEGYLEWMRGLPVEQTRPLKLFWRHGTGRDGAGGEQPDLTPQESTLMVEEAELALHEEGIAQARRWARPVA